MHLVNFEIEHQGVITLVDLAGEAQLNENGISGNVTTIGFDKQVSVGRGDCTFNWAGAEAGAQAPVRFATMDLAGNFSGWTEASSVEIPSSGGCQAMKHTSSEGGLASTMVLFMLLAMRLRTRLPSNLS